MPIFFLMMVLGAVGIVYIAFKDVDNPPWKALIMMVRNRNFGKGKEAPKS
jgi:hypothetical protein